jgi:hypothetical protein
MFESECLRTPSEGDAQAVNVESDLGKDGCSSDPMQARKSGVVAEYCNALRKRTLSDAQQLVGLGVPWSAVTLVCPAPRRVTSIGQRRCFDQTLTGRWRG